MALFDSKVSVFQINDGSQLRNISPFVISVDGLPGLRELVDVTALGASGRLWKPGLDNVVITLELLMDDTASTGTLAIFNTLRQDATARAFDYGPKGLTVTFPKISGTCWVRNAPYVSRVGDYVKARVELQVEGGISIGAYA